MNNLKEGRKKEIIREAAADFLSGQSNKMSLITVTDVRLSNRGNRALIRFTVLPENKESEALSFAKRKRSDFRKYLKEKTGLVILPFVDFEIDAGQKNMSQLLLVKP